MFTTDNRATMFDSIDIELASLGRLENVVLAAGQILREEQDALSRSRLVLVLSLAERITERRTAAAAAATAAAAITTVPSSLNSIPHQQQSSGLIAVLSDFAIYHEEIAVIDRSDDMFSGHDDNGGGGNTSGNITAATTTSAQRMHSDRILEIIRTVITNNHEYQWLDEQFQAYVTTRYKLWSSGNAVIRERLCSSERLHLLVSTESPFFRDLRTRARTNNNDDKSNDCERLRKVDIAVDVLLATTFLFFQWYGLMSVLPIEYDKNMMNFLWIPEHGVIRIFSRETTFANPANTTTTAGSIEQQNIDDDDDDDDDDDNDDIRLSFGGTFGGHARLIGRLVNRGGDGGVKNNYSTVVGTMSMLSNERAMRFAVSNGRYILHEKSRSSCRPIAILSRGSPSERQHCHIRERNGYVELAELAERRRRRGISTTTKTLVTAEEKSRRNVAAAAARQKLPPDCRLTEEQERVLRVIERVLGISLTSPPQRSAHVSSADGTSHVAPPARNANDVSSRSSKRVIVDGVAGAGKTFLLTILLQRFKRVRYLVKKRNFVEAVTKRFEHNETLHAQTIDSFLMRQLGIRNLHSWLQMLRTDSDALGRRVYECRLRPNCDELVFVDEYSLIENSLAEMLNRALCESMVVLVGDCNQQPAIGEHEDQPIRTLLGYEHVCFMYDNVRARDINLLARLEFFNVKSDMTRALLGLPLRRTIEMRTFLASGRDCRFDFSLLPRVIVKSNENVNYLNWAIGYLIWHHCGDDDDAAAAWSAREGLPRCMRYQRAIISPSERVTERIVSSFVNDGDDCCNDDCEAYPTAPDDPYGDEHFIIEGMRYRMIHACPSWPMQVGSRVIVRRIESRNAVIVEMDDDCRITYRLTRTRVKPYEYGSRWSNSFETNDETADTPAAAAVNFETTACPDVYLYMFPFVMDAATTVYQVQGVTLNHAEYAHCYVDLQCMDNKALYVTLSRFECEAQIRGVTNISHICM